MSPTGFPLEFPSCEGVYKSKPSIPIRLLCRSEQRLLDLPFGTPPVSVLSLIMFGWLDSPLNFGWLVTFQGISVW
ncbi:hypothetical protein LINPERHAP1_LOCUS20781, partial [Linum perenne]